MKCIFIGGADRSGTTMLASLLSNIEQSVVTPESLFKTEIPFKQPLCTKSYCNSLEENLRFKQWQLDISELKAQSHSEYRDFYKDLVKLYCGDENVRYWIDHSPNNLAHSKLLNSIFDDCYFIHIVRDGRAVAQSQIPLEWGSNTYLDAAKAWQNKLLYGFITQSLFPNKTIMVRYEDLLTNSEAELKRIYTFLGSPNTKDELKIKNNFLPKFTKKQHSLVGKKPDVTRAYAWRQKLTSQNIADFQYYGKESLDLLDYEIINTGNIKVTKIHIAKQYIKELWTKKFLNPKKYKEKRKHVSK
ncbi:sulfotransferase [Pseudoalteromonas sp. Angola-7]|uniref:sulfotransferase family protein n=1 Tax=Pseudoalteromonas sp. Angola-7 TaxID=3025336 RepID=UPI002359ED9A|nr:sulfotransferase [Pseudoalteromonas sp. Angola-7]MDC9529385.1 sulfotransferase [Pseudoalteromonas sp. Angola-7]